MRATEFFSMSIIPTECLFVGVECSSYDAFLQGHCNCGYNGERCRLMGQYSEPAEHETRYFLQLWEEKPYCLHQYQVIVHLEVNSEHKTYETVDAVLNLKLKARNSFQEHLKISINLLEEWQTHKFLLTFESPVGKPEIASASIQHTEHAHCVSLEDIEINYLLPV
nr:uncharacterized protein LOC107441941 [Parasteatoda tepidariorum]